MAIKVFAVDTPPEFPGICISGPTGAGKTTLASTMPGRGLILDVPTVEGGAFVIPKNRAHRIKGVTLTSWADLEEVYWAIVKQDNAQFQEHISEKWPGLQALDWVCIDSITGLSSLAREKIIAERDRRRKGKSYQFDLNEYGYQGNLVGWKVPEFQKLPMVKIWIAQERTHGGYDDDPGPTQIGPAVTRSALLLLRSPMTVMGRLSVEGDKERRVLTVGPPGGDYIVKARVMPGRRLPNRIRDPHLGQILSYMFADGPRPKAAPNDSIL